ncbi:MAG: hypothetical protein KAR57_03285 [Bacteroidales bacterium]|nr:hypothetical protein [Bacteroidales bacterium]
MKKVLSLIAIPLFATAILTSSCSKDNPVSCAQKLVEVTSAAQDYALDDSDANCITYKNALEDYVNCDGITDKAYYQTLLENLPCY